MFNQTRRIGEKLGKNLLRLDREPIGKAALVIVIFLDLFILVSIFTGLSDHSKQLTSPLEFIPRYCRDIVIDGDWNETNRLEKIARIASVYRNRYSRVKKGDPAILHPGCARPAELIEEIKNSPIISKRLDDLTKLEAQLRLTRTRLGMVNDAYQNRLLETIAEKPERTDATGINAVVGESTENLDTLVAKQRELKLSLVEELPITALFGLIDSLEETDRQLLVTDLRSANFWFPVKRLGMEMIFLAPLVLVFWFWNSKSIVNNRPFQVLVSSHLLVIVFIPVVFKIIELLYDIIPRKLLQQLIELLESLHLIALWHYLLMGVAILLALACVYVFQKRWFSHEKLLEKRIAKGQCQDCGGKLPTDCIACPRCGFKQFEDCSNCQDPTYVHGKYCINCGIDRS